MSALDTFRLPVSQHARGYEPITKAHSGSLCVNTMRFATYNPLSLKNRLTEVSLYLKGIDFIALQGTQIRAVQDKEVRVQKEDYHTALHWGLKETIHSNKSCGVSILLAKWVKLEHIIEIYNPPKHLQGRLGAVRVKAHHIDLLIISAYYPSTARQGEHQTRSKTIKDMNNWIQARLKAIPIRCTPLIGMDLNDKLGVQGKETIHDETVGPFHPGKQNETANAVRTLFFSNVLPLLTHTGQQVLHTMVNRHYIL